MATRGSARLQGLASEPGLNKACVLKPSRRACASVVPPTYKQDKRAKDGGVPLRQRHVVILWGIGGGHGGGGGSHPTRLESNTHAWRINGACLPTTRMRTAIVPKARVSAHINGQHADQKRARNQCLCDGAPEAWCERGGADLSRSSHNVRRCEMWLRQLAAKHACCFVFPRRNGGSADFRPHSICLHYIMTATR